MPVYLQQMRKTIREDLQIAALDKKNFAAQLCNTRIYQLMYTCRLWSDITIMMFQKIEYIECMNACMYVSMYVCMYRQGQINVTTASTPPPKHLPVVVRFSIFFFAGKVLKKLVGWYVEFFDFFDFEGCRAKKGFSVFFAALP